MSGNCLWVPGFQENTGVPEQPAEHRSGEFHQASTTSVQVMPLKLNSDVERSRVRSGLVGNIQCQAVDDFGVIMAASTCELRNSR